MTCRRSTRGSWKGIGPLGLIVLCALLALEPSAPAEAGPAPATVADAKTLFKAGAEAYGNSDFKAALHAFEAARALVPDPALTFSIAQAHRRLYQASESPAHLRSAVAEYRRYLSEVPRGGRRGDAAEALVALESKLAGLEEEDYAAEQPARQATRLMVLSSVEGARVSIDDAPAEAAPFIGEVEPGRHVVRVAAAGYRPYVRTVQLEPGQVAPIDANLEALPARLLVRGDDGAALWIDGRPRGVLPMTTPIPVAPGRRLIGVTQDGYRRFEIELYLDKGQSKEMDVVLETTAQRTLSIVTLALGGASLVTAGIMAGVAGAKYQATKDTLDAWNAGEPIDEQELQEYRDGRLDHKPFGVAAAATGAVGLALAVTGGLLYLFDDAAPASQVGSSRTSRWRVGVAPSPGGALAGASLRF